MRAVSFHPDDAYRGFAVPEGIVEVVKAYSDVFKSKSEHVQVGVVLVVKAQDASETEIHLSAGFLRELVPSIDGDEASWSPEESKYLPGNYLIPNPGAERVQSQADGKANLVFFNARLIDGGFPAENFYTAEGVPRTFSDIYVGIKGEMKNIPNPEQIQKKGLNAGKPYNCPCFVDLNPVASKPSAGTTATATSSATAASKPNGAPAATDANTSELAEAWALAVIQKNGPRTPAELANDFFGMSLQPHASLGKLTQDQRRQFRAAFKDEAFLGQLVGGGSVKFEGGKVSAA